MVNKKDISNKSSGSRPRNAVKKTPSTKKKTPKNTLEFENLISGFSAALIDTPEESLESELKNWLKKFVEFLKVDRCTVDEYLDDKKTIRLIMNYIVPEIEPVKIVKNFKPSDGVIEELEKGAIIKAEKIPEDLPKIFRGGLIEKDKTKSVVIVPLSIGNKVIGSLSFSCYRKERKWSNNLARRIKLIGEIIANTILRIRAHKSLIEEMSRRETLENRYSAILKNANVGFFISDLNQNILEVNDEYCRISGYTHDELLAKKLYEIDASQNFEKVDKDGEKPGAHLRTSHIRKDGSIFNVELSGNYFEEEGVICTFVRDITDLTRAREQLEERLEFEELISEFSAALMSPDDYLRELNDWVMTFVKYLGVDRGIIIEHLADLRTIRVLVQYTVPGLDITPFEEFIPIQEDEIEGFQEGMFLRAEKIPEDLPEKLRGGPIENDGTKSVIMVPLSVGTKAIGTLTFASHITEHKWSDEVVRRIRLIGEIIANVILRKRSSDALLEEVNRRKILEERYSSIIKNANIGFWISDIDQNILVVNDEYCRMSGYNREELLSIKIPDIDISFDPEDEKITEDILGIGASHHEATHRKKDGTLMELDVSSTLLESESLLFSFMRDITELNKTRREQEERLKFEELASEFSAELINIPPDNIYDELQTWLEKFVNFLDVDRSVVNEYINDQKNVKVLMQYTVPDIELSNEGMRKTPDGIIAELEKGLIRAEKIPEDLPQGFRGGHVEKHKTMSLIIVPLLTGNKVFGNLSFSSYKKERKWPDDLVRRIKLIGEIVGNAILRKRSHDALTEEMEQRKLLEERYTSVIKNADLGFMVSNMNSIILDVNEAYCEMSGYSRDELLGMSVAQLDTSLLNENELTPEKKEKLKKTGLFIETTHRKKDGAIIDVALSSNFLEKEELIFNFIRDITASNQAKEEQAERLKFEELISEFSTALINIRPTDIINELEKWLEKFVGLIDADRGAVNEYSDDQKIIYNLIQYSVSEVQVPIPDVRKTPEGEIIELEKGIIRVEKIPEDLPRMFRESYIEKSDAKSLIIVPLYTGNRVFGNLAFTNYRKERRWSDELIRRVKLIAEIVGNAILRLRSHEALLEEMERRHVLEERYSSIIKTANVGFMASDLNAGIVEVNDAYCEMSGYSRDELLQMKIYQLDASDPDKVDKDKNDIFETGSFHHETVHIRKDGKAINVFISANFLENEKIIYSFIRDVTELKIATEDLEDRLKFEELTSDFSAALINLKLDKIDEELNPWLQKFVDFFEVERGIINEYLYEKGRVNAIAAYTDPGVDVPPTDRRNQAPESIMKKLAKGDVIRAEKIPEDLHPIFNEGIIKSHKTKSIVIVPLFAENQIIGNLTFITYTKEHKWSDELLRRIRLIGEIIANAILRKRSNDALIEEMKSRHMVEEKYTSIIKNASVGFTISDENQNILDVNNEYCRMSGYTYDELTKMKISDIDYSESAEKVDDDIVKTIEGEGGIFHHQTSHIRKDGSIFDVDVHSQYSASEGFFFSFVRDVTELNKARKELEGRLKFEELVSEFSAALINVKIKEIKNELNLWLKRFAGLMDVDRCAIGEYEKDFSIYRFICTYSNTDLDPELPPIPSVMQNDWTYGLEKYLMKGELIKLENPNDMLPEDLNKWKQEILDDGTKSIIMLPLTSGETLLGSMVMSSLRHETKWTHELIRRLKLVAEIFSNALIREKSDSELDNYRKHLEKMVEERTARLEEAQKELVLSEKMATLGRLTATVSHELRNPLGTIRSSVFSVQSRLGGQDEKVATALDRAERNIKRCDLIIDELLNYSSGHDLYLEPTPVDKWLIEVLEDTAPPKGISIKKDLISDTLINMDQERFRRCMVNILTNAYQSIEEKNNDEPGYINVITYRNLDNLIIEVSDNGVGFEVENKDKLFEPLYSTKAFGVGLGIPITRQILEQHGWNMDITGEPQKGATVTITIPL